MAVKVPSMQDLLEAGVHFGHKLRRGNPRMKPYIFGARDGVHIIDLAKSEEKLAQAVEFAQKLGQEGKTLLIIGTKKQARQIVESLAKEVGAFYITDRWVGGLLTNFDEIRKNIRKLVDLKLESEQGNLSHYTKKERLLISRKLEKFNIELGGVADMHKLPDAVFIVDTASDLAAVKEAMNLKLLTIGFSDTNSDPSFLDYPIPANDDGIKSIKIISEAVIKAYGEGKKSAKTLADKAEADLQTAKDIAIEAEVTPTDEVVAVIEEEVEKEVSKDFERKAA